MPDISETIELIKYHHRTRNFAQDQRKRQDLALLSFLRIQLGWSRALPESDRKRIAGQAKALVAVGEAAAKRPDAPPPEADTDDFREWAPIIAAALAARAPFDTVEAAATKEMERLAKQLPVWGAWAAEVRGLGARSLAVIVGEAGDLGAYPTKGHLWKRMGLAVIGGVRQGGLAKTASAAAWIEHGYSRQRRSRMFVVGDCLVKSGEAYRALYLARKEIERAKAEAAGLTVAPAGKIPKGRAAEFISDGHVHRRSQRWMEKALLRDLRAAWRRATDWVPGRASERMPAATGRAARAA